MTGTTHPCADLDLRRRRILFRAWRRGTRETDLIMGGFADRHIASLTEVEIDEFERLIKVLDLDLFQWINGELPVPPEHDTLLFRRVVAFHTHNTPINI